MKNITKTIMYLQMTALFLTAALAGPVAAGAEVPFKGRLEGFFTVTPLVPPFARVLIEATGNATHLGRFTVENRHVVPFVTSGSGSYEFTAANGDTLTADFTITATPTPDGLFIVVEIATITGGTGRFDGATGSFTVIRLLDRAARFTSGSFDGSIVIHSLKHKAK
jgi:hypothetical protein